MGPTQSTGGGKVLQVLHSAGMFTDSDFCLNDSDISSYDCEF